MVSCDICGRETSMKRCWLLSCPSNGGREAWRAIQEGPLFNRRPEPPAPTQGRML